MDPGFQDPAFRSLRESQQLAVVNNRKASLHIGVSQTGRTAERLAHFVGGGQAAPFIFREAPM